MKKFRFLNISSFPFFFSFSLSPSLIVTTVLKMIQILLIHIFMFHVKENCNSMKKYETGRKTKDFRTLGGSEVKETKPKEEKKRKKKDRWSWRKVMSMWLWIYYYEYNLKNELNEETKRWVKKPNWKNYRLEKFWLYFCFKLNCDQNSSTSQKTNKITISKIQEL